MVNTWSYFLLANKLVSPEGRLLSRPPGRPLTLEGRLLSRPPGRSLTLGRLEGSWGKPFPPCRLPPGRLFMSWDTPLFRNCDRPLTNCGNCDPSCGNCAPICDPNCGNCAPICDSCGSCDPSCWICDPSCGWLLFSCTTLILGFLSHVMLAGFPKY